MFVCHCNLDEALPIFEEAFINADHSNRIIYCLLPVFAVFPAQFKLLLFLLRWITKLYSIFILCWSRNTSTLAWSAPGFTAKQSWHLVVETASTSHTALLYFTLRFFIDHRQEVLLLFTILLGDQRSGLIKEQNPHPHHHRPPPSLSCAAKGIQCLIKGQISSRAWGHKYLNLVLWLRDKPSQPCRLPQESSSVISGKGVEIDCYITTANCLWPFLYLWLWLDNSILFLYIDDTVVESGEKKKCDKTLSGWYTVIVSCRNRVIDNAITAYKPKNF